MKGNRHQSVNLIDAAKMYHMRDQSKIGAVFVLNSYQSSLPNQNCIENKFHQILLIL